MKNYITYIFVVLIVFFIPKIQYASIITSNGTGGGTWSDAGTWSPSVPGCADTILILAGDSVYIGATVDLLACGPVYLEISGVIEFQTGKKMEEGYM